MRRSLQQRDLEANVLFRVSDDISGFRVRISRIPRENPISQRRSRAISLPRSTNPRIVSLVKSSIDARTRILMKFNYCVKRAVFFNIKFSRYRNFVITIRISLPLSLCLSFSSLLIYRLPTNSNLRAYFANLPVLRKRLFAYACQDAQTRVTYSRQAADQE